MKKKFITTILLISLMDLAAQKNFYIMPVRQDTTIQWAAECDKVVNLSSAINQFSLKKWYMDKLKNGSVTAYREDERSRTLFSYNLSMPGLQTQDWLNGLSIELSPYKHPQHWFFIDKSKPKNDIDRVQFHGGDLNWHADSCCGCDDADAFRAKQVLEYKDGTFSIYNVFISPLCARKKGNNQIDWYPLCNVAYQENIKSKFPGPGKDVLLLNTDELDYSFGRENPSPYDSVADDYHIDIGQLIYQDILAGKIKPVDIESGKPIPAKNLLTWKMPSDTMPVYDNPDIVKITTYKVVQHERKTSELSHLRFTLDLYFDFKNERLYSLIRSVIIMMPVRTIDGLIRGYTPFCKIN